MGLPAVSKPESSMSNSGCGATLESVTPTSEDSYAVCIGESLRRIADILLSGAGLIVLLPFLMVCTVFIKLDSPGPLLFSQKRVGKNGREFRLYKLRSMYLDAEQRRDSLKQLNDASGPLFKIKQDPRVTRVGRFLRRSSIDELPQLINVFLGEMTLVGPRPALPNEVATYSPLERKRLDVKPGLTGLWQVSGRADLPYHEAIRLDIAYVDQRSVLLDLKILAKTLPAVLGGRGAY